uniref:Uncharacterized protein n=1 Tax=Solanum lycopersicum TaxID=4081 RepID=A0A494G8I5_SOLLC
MLSKCDYGIPSRSRSTVFVVQGQRWYVTPAIIRPRVLPNGNDGIARNLVQPCTLSKGDTGIPRRMPSNHVCCRRDMRACHARHHVSYPKAIMICHAQCFTTVCAIQSRRWHVKHDVVQPLVLPNFDYEMPCLASSH